MMIEILRMRHPSFISWHGGVADLTPHHGAGPSTAATLLTWGDRYPGETFEGLFWIVANHSENPSMHRKLHETGGRTQVYP
jgi:hypothetical protein